MSHYDREMDDGLLARARFLAACKAIADITFGLRTGWPEYIEAGVRALRLSFTD
jgi:hypothetical protein